MRRIVTAAALAGATALAAGAVVAGAVGGGDPAPHAGHAGGPAATPLSTAAATAPAQVRRIAAAPDALAYSVTTLRATPGRVRIVMSNPSPFSHNVALRGNGLRAPVVGKVVGQGGRSVVVADVTPGRYTFYCSVPGHAQAGMTGVLIVRR